MTVYLKGKGGRLDQIEKDVEKIETDDRYIHISYAEPYQWGIVSGVSYYRDEMEIEKVEA